MCSLNSLLNKTRAPNDRLNQPSHLVSPDFQNGSARVMRSSSIVRELGNSPNQCSVAWASALVSVNGVASVLMDIVGSPGDEGGGVAIDALGYSIDLGDLWDRAHGGQRAGDSAKLDSVRRGFACRFGVFGLGRARETRRGKHGGD